MTITRGTGESDPGAAGTPAEYVALLRRLKERSGLTYRQLEQKAAERGDVLARSTLADVLRRDALPRAELVTALVRACGAQEEESAWLAARERLAAASGNERGSVSGESAESTGAAESAGAPDPREPTGPRRDAAGSRSRTASLAALASLGTVALLVVGALVLLPEDGKPSATGGADGRAQGSAAGPGASEAAGAWQTPEAGASPETGPVGPGPTPGISRIRPAGAPGLCLTDGEVRADGAGSKVVAVQRPCGEAVPPTTSLLKAGDRSYRIQWDHPVHDKGCLTVLDDGPFRNTLEPWDDCSLPGASQLFRIERAEGGEGWRLLPETGDDLCVGIRGGADETGAAAVVEPCLDGAPPRQRFLIGRG
ncbi:helix-turn-helix domain-containing protein [Streptomyces viridiviolaceus]